MGEIIGKSFENGPTCRGIAFSEPGAPLDLSHIEISGRYPLGQNDWSMFEEKYVQVWVNKGAGKLLIKDRETIELKAGTSCKIEPGTRYAWLSSEGGTLEFLMAVSPAFDDGTGYKVEVENEIQSK